MALQWDEDRGLIVVREDSGTRFKIVDFHDDHAPEFRALNLAWIIESFPVEKEDERQLEDPRASILDAGGEILIAVDQGRVVGTCALLLRSATEFELAKVTVSSEHRRRGIGEALLQSAIQKARNRGMHRIVLVSNSTLSSARRLFSRFGFVETPLVDELYEHADVAMVLELAN